MRLAETAPFPWFGGKSRVSHLVWQRFGHVGNYVEPFAGSLAVLLARPDAPAIETVNDMDGFICNAWRSIQHHPHETARHATNPVNECDLHARNYHLASVREGFALRLMADPGFCDPKVAGWWLWCVACWIGSGAATYNGPWRPVDGVFTNAGQGVTKKLPHLGDAGRGVTKQLPHLGDAGQGVTKKLPHLGNAGPHDPSDGLLEWFDALAHRLRTVRVCCRDWKRVVTPSVLRNGREAAVFLDPPYGCGKRDGGLYATDSFTVAQECLEWCLANGGDKRLRVALCGYEGEHDVLQDEGWECVPWKARGGYAGQGDGSNQNSHRERVWFSPACLSPQPRLLDD